MKVETRWHKLLSKTVGIFSQFPRSRYLVEGGIFLLLALATVILHWKMIRDGISGQGDLKWHLPWLQHFSKQLAEGIWYPRWLAGTNYGYGSPSFVFQPPLVFYLGSWLKFSGLDTQDAVIVLFSLALFLSGLTFYIYGRKKWGTLASLIGALAYMTAPYIAFDIHWRGGIASVFVQAWIPLIWYLTEQSLSYSKWRPALAIAWTGLALTHVPSLLLCAVIWLPYTFFGLLNKPWKAVVTTILSAGIGLGMASVFLLPAILEQSFLDLEYIKQQIGGMSSNLIGVGMPLFPFNRITYIFAHQSLVIIILTIVALACCRHRDSARREIYSWFGFALMVAFLMSSLSEPIWQASSTLQKVQFAWRLLTFFSFAGAALCALTVREILKLRLSLKLLFSLIIMGILLTNFRYSYQQSRQFIGLRNPGRGNIEHLRYIKTILDDPYTDKLRDYAGYRPALTNGRPSPPTPVMGQPRISLINGQAEIQIDQWSSYERIFKITAAEASTIRVRTYYYPAWHLYLDQKPHPIVMADDGTIKFQLEPGVYQVHLRYQRTPAFILGGILSILSIILLIIFGFFSADKRTSRKLS
ncbi:6-pyruvoyl-tetrahydropterin synthase-related protein [Crocosphaera sp. XPORK-15E]|uniref:6-pyruvoyl-tetrahydropterin synthase-related protein n=1 Tax=Crocosphaera sp. XPORK-15E TaxID=3110247 RepID=UPI002B1E9E97|nr:6-pyruvoyl-tetrahydropterin synthase-related protein [Crocosphaera sp. XPORK-15E]MEA5533420.1 6-pyruvoyl-tetrahydropterin synthase-related protein [Crocosphaera sp. XPORK-15E]